MDAPVADELFKRQPCDLPAHGIERRKRDRLRRIVDDEIDARQRFERADVPALAADDAAFHFVVWQRYDGYRRLRHMVGRDLLDGERDQLARFLFGVFLQLLLDLL